MRLFDCITFFNEFELLRLRFMEYYDFVDHFVIVEATKSHTGKPKPLYFRESVERFKEFKDKVILVTVDNMPEYRAPDNIWAAENYQRNCIMSGLEGKAQPEDRIFISDCDELWDKETVKLYFADDIITFQQELYYYYVNCKQNCTWNGSIMVPYGLLKASSPQRIRGAARWGKYNLKSPGGWHYSYMGGAAKVKEKAENIAESHVIINDVGSVEEIQKKMDSTKDLWNRTEDYAQKQLVPLQYTPTRLPEFLMLYPNFYKAV